MHAKPKNKFVAAQRRGNREVQEQGAAGVRPLHQAAGRRRRRRQEDPRRGRSPGGEVLEIAQGHTSGASCGSGGIASMAETSGKAARPASPAGRAASSHRQYPGGVRRRPELRHGHDRHRQRGRPLHAVGADPRRLRHRRHPVRLRHLRVPAVLPTEARQRARRFLHPEARRRGSRPRSTRSAICSSSPPSSCSRGGSITACWS